MTIPSPLLPGFHPDPTICHANGEYFLATSSFTYYPGIPIHASKDFHTWELVSHVLEGSTWIDMEGFRAVDGVWAPTLRYHDGIFYVIFGVAKDYQGIGVYISRSSNPRLGWEKPVQIPDVEGIDPSLYFDPTGRCWLQGARDKSDPHSPQPGEIWLREFDINQMQFIGPTKVIWTGSQRGAWIEAPHIYKENGKYHLIVAEGGTERLHSVTAALAENIEGPYILDRRSPLLTHRHLDPTWPIQSVGHVDIVDSPEGSSKGVALATRPIDGYSTMGRETFFVPAKWTGDGLYLASDTGYVPYEESSAAPGPISGLEWMSLRGPMEFEVNNDSLSIGRQPEGLDSLDAVTFACFPQTAHRFHLSATLGTEQLHAGDAGLAAFQNESHFAQVVCTSVDDGVEVRIEQTVGGEKKTLNSGSLTAPTIKVSISSTGTSYVLSAESVDGQAAVSASLPHLELSVEKANSFTGVTLGFLAQGDPSDQPMDFQDIALT